MKSFKGITHKGIIDGCQMLGWGGFRNGERRWLPIISGGGGKKGV